MMIKPVPRPAPVAHSGADCRHAVVVVGETGDGQQPPRVPCLKGLWRTQMGYPEGTMGLNHVKQGGPRICQLCADWEGMDR